MKLPLPEITYSDLLLFKPSDGQRYRLQFTSQEAAQRTPVGGEERVEKVPEATHDDLQVYKRIESVALLRLF